MSPSGMAPVWQPLSPLQEGMWFMQRLAPQSTAWHLARAFHLRGPLDTAALGLALARVRERQAVLRTRFAERDGMPYQIADLPADTPLNVLDLAGAADADGSERDAALAAVLADEAARPFDLAHEGAARFRLVKLSAQWHVLSVVVHHLISDGGSNAIFARELAEAYRDALRGAADDRIDLKESGEENGGEPREGLAWQYTDFAAWQRTQLAGEKARADLAWWKQYIGTPDNCFELPGDFPSAPQAKRVARTHTFALSETALYALRARCKAERCTSFVVLMAAYQIVLWRHAGSADFCIGVPTSGRTLAECEHLIGLFVDTRVHRARIEPSMSARALLESVRHDTRAALDHSDVTLPVLVDALGVRREADRHPLFQTLFNVQGPAAAGELSLDGLEVEIVDAESPLARFDLSVDVRVSAEAVRVTARYDGTLYRPQTIERLFAHYEALLAALCREPDRAVVELLWLDHDERAGLAAWSTQRADYGEPVPVHRLFERQAAARPDADALLFDGTTLTYGELDARANRLAQRLRRLGVGPDAKVGIGVTHWTCRTGEAVVPIGRPIANVSTHVLDAALNPLPVGVAGELYLGGAGLVRDYLDRPALTAERFVPDPFEPGARLYRSGDLARWRADGALDYLGRLDHQVKIRGLRIELGEIEAVLQRQEGVETAVVAAQDGLGGKRLVAYVSARAGYRLDRDTLTAGLAAALPDYMVPTAWVELERFPLSPNGKIDRRALPLPEAPEHAWEAPQGEAENALATIWQQLLGVARVGRHDNFFELGGDSILSLKVQRRVARELAADVELAALFAAPTLEAFARAVDESRPRTASGPAAMADTMQSLLSDLMQ
ncbi:condensation domain-containing protein [Paraburkholderia acidipaludis]|uniref:condensation domain-containing protein n=1 Tax=Paraburkholderia acidipaludis TaxID=660537 RepID=UPI001C3F19BF|nr:condensation domain-containing protein [Paraburkholderia acidipaludis]